MTTNAGRGAAQEPLEGGGGSEGPGREVAPAWARFPVVLAKPLSAAEREHQRVQRALAELQAEYRAYLDSRGDLR